MYKCKDCSIFGSCSDIPGKEDSVCEEFEKRKNGLNSDEDMIMQNLINAWNEFTKLDRQHPSELQDFADGIHKLQSILGLRVLRRDYPSGWPIKE